MTADESTIRGVVENYLRLVADGTAAEIADLYADDATVEDPVGSDVLTTREQILGFYGGLEGLDQETSLLWCRVVGGEALFGFEIVTTVGDKQYRLSPYDHMTFADDGTIASMRAFWGPGDMS